MEATKDFISLETAKLLKDCGVESKFVYTKSGVIEYDKQGYFQYFATYKLPAYTWQEIEDNTELFFGIESYYFRKTIDFKIPQKESERIKAPIQGIDDFTDTEYILFLRQQKKYKEADQYFRYNCILIKN